MLSGGLVDFCERAVGHPPQRDRNPQVEKGWSRVWQESRIKQETISTQLVGILDLPRQSKEKFFKPWPLATLLSLRLTASMAAVGRHEQRQVVPSGVTTQAMGMGLSVSTMWQLFQRHRKSGFPSPWLKLCYSFGGQG